MKYQRSDVCFGKVVINNDDNSRLEGVTVITKGELKDGRGIINQGFLERVADLGNKEANGVKARFAHPNLSADGTGRFLGRFTEFRIDEDVVRADLHISETAEITPHGDLKKYVIEMARKEPDMIGASMVFEPDYENQTVTDDGQQVLAIKSLFACDIVDDPASNNGLFSAFSSDSAAARVTAFLDENEDVYRLVHNHPEVMANFLSRYEAWKNQNTGETKMGEDNKNAKEPQSPQIDLSKVIEDAKEEARQECEIRFSEADETAHNHFRSIYETYGADAACEFYLNGKTESEILAAKLEALQSENELLKKQCDDGEQAVKFASAEINNDADTDEQDDRFTAVLSPGLAKFARRITIPKGK